jgi:hypothetical protein
VITFFGSVSSALGRLSIANPAVSARIRSPSIIVVSGISTNKNKMYGFR